MTTTSPTQDPKFPPPRHLTTSHEDGRGVYLYCFARQMAVGHVSNVPPQAGIDGLSPVESLEVNGITAVFCEVALEEFRAAVAAEDGVDPAWLLPRACRHEQVIDAVLARSSPSPQPLSPAAGERGRMNQSSGTSCPLSPAAGEKGRGEGAVLPIRFGAVFSSRQALERLLTERWTDIARCLDAVSGKEEWSVKAFVDVERASEWFVDNDPALAERRQQLPASQGARYLQEKRFRADVRKQIQSWSRTIAEQLREELHSLAEEVRPLKLTQGTYPGKEIVFHSAVLIASSSVAHFQEQLELLQARYAEQGVILDGSGPWPPYSFCPSLEDSDETPCIRHSA